MGDWIKACIVAPVAMILSTTASAQTVQTMNDVGVYHAPRSHSVGLVDTGGSVTRTFVTWAGQGMDVWIRAYNHGTSAWETPSRIRDNNYTDENAYHDYPTIVVAPISGRLLVFFAKHNEQIYQLTSPGAHSSSGTWAFKAVSGVSGRAYPSPVVVGNSIYVFFRLTLGETYRTLQFVRSTDDGATWSAPQTVVDTQNNDPDELDTVYLNDISADPSNGRIRLTWMLAGGRNTGGSLEHNYRRKNVYFAYLRTSDNSLGTVTGHPLGNVVDGGDLSEAPNTKLLAAAAAPSNISSSVDCRWAVDGRMGVRPLLVNGSERPLIGYNFCTGTTRRAYTTYWNGSAWQVRAMLESGAQVPGFISDFQRVSDTTVRAMMLDGTTLRLKQSSNQGASWSTVFSYSAAPQLINGADEVFYAIAVGSSSNPIDFLVSTRNGAEAKTAEGYSGKWRVFTLSD